MDRFRKFVFLIASLAMAGVVTAACDSGTQEPAAPDSSMQHSAGESMDSHADSSSHPGGTPEGPVADLPKEFPEEIPVYPGSVPAQGRGATSDGVPMAAVQLRTSDEPKKVYDFYVDKFSRDGWTIEANDGLAKKNAVSATNGKCSATVLAAPNEDGSSSIFLFTEC